MSVFAIRLFPKLIIKPNINVLLQETCKKNYNKPAIDKILA